MWMLDSRFKSLIYYGFGALEDLWIIWKYVNQSLQSEIYRVLMQVVSGKKKKVGTNIFKIYLCRTSLC